MNTNNNIISKMFEDNIFHRILTKSGITENLDDLASALLLHILDYQSTSTIKFETEQCEIYALIAIAKLRVANVINADNIIVGSSKLVYFNRSITKALNLISDEVSTNDALIEVFLQVQDGLHGKTAQREIKTFKKFVSIAEGFGSSVGISLNVENKNGSEAIDAITSTTSSTTKGELSHTGTEASHSIADGGITLKRVCFQRDVETIIDIINAPDLTKYATNVENKNIIHYKTIIGVLATCQLSLDKLNFTSLGKQYAKTLPKNVKPLTHNAVKSKYLVDNALAFFSRINPQFKSILRNVIYKSNLYL